METKDYDIKGPRIQVSIRNEKEKGKNKYKEAINNFTRPSLLIAEFRLLPYQGMSPNKYDVRKSASGKLKDKQNLPNQYNL